MKVAHRSLDPAVNRPRLNKICALAVMTKAPRAGQVKTRLVPPLTLDEAAQLNICFLRDTAAAITKTSRAKARGVGVYTPLGAEFTYAEILPADFDLLVQRGDNFGERLTNAAQDLFQIGFESVCLIDSDSPTVSAESYAEAVDLLSINGDRVVLGPSDDGGYYLIGMKVFHRELFSEIDWSTERVFRQTEARAAALGLETKLLPSCYDVDERAALHRLCEDLLGGQANLNLDAALNTREFLNEIISREGRDRIWPRPSESTTK